MGGKLSNHLKTALHKFQGVRTWQLALVLIPLAFVIATLLRLDHLKMSDLRSAVLEADAMNDDMSIDEALFKLKKFVFSHIVINVVEDNGVQSITFGTGPFYLEQQYLRDANKAIEEQEAELADDTNPNGNIYAATQAICRPLAIANGWTWNNPNYLDCWTTELAKYPSSESLESNLTASIPSTELYRHSYASPLWAPTWSGWAILLFVAILIIVVVRIVIWAILRIALLLSKETA